MREPKQKTDPTSTFPVKVTLRYLRISWKLILFCLALQLGLAEPDPLLEDRELHHHHGIIVGPPPRGPWLLYMG